MAPIGMENLRNVTLVGHGGSGKTTLADAMLFAAGAASRLGRVSEGTSVFDHDQDEIERRITISASIAHCDWKGTRITVMDTPGYADFFAEVCGALTVTESAVLVVDAVAGVDVQTEKAWEIICGRQMPCIVFINKMDAERASFEAVIQQLRSELAAKAVALQLPVGSVQQFRGVVDLSLGKCYAQDQPGQSPAETEIPDDMRDQMATAREALTEAAAEGNEVLLEKYLETLELSDEEIHAGLSEAVAQAKAVPVVCGSADKVLGVQALLNTIVSYLPSPALREEVHGVKPGTETSATLPTRPEAPLCAQVFKTLTDPYVGRLSFLRVYTGELRSDSQVHNANTGERERIGQVFLVQGKEQQPFSPAGPGSIVAVAKLEHTQTGHTLCQEANSLVLPEPRLPQPALWVGVSPTARGDEEKMSVGLTRLCEEDRSFKWRRDPETGQTLIGGLGDLHLEVMGRRLERKFGVSITSAPVKVAYKETIRLKARAEGKYKRQTGGRGQYGDAWITIEPLPRGTGIEFVDAIVGGVIPGKFIPAVEKGLREAMSKGILAGYPFVDMRATVDDGKHHPVDSSDLAFQIAGSLGFKAAAETAQPYLLEPIMLIEVTIPEENMGDIIGDLNGKRARILGVDPAGRYKVVKAHVPLSEIARYATDLRSVTRGRGTYRTEFAYYEEVPAHLSTQIKAQAQREKDEE